MHPKSIITTADGKTLAIGECPICGKDWVGLPSRVKRLKTCGDPECARIQRGLSNRGKTIPQEQRDHLSELRMGRHFEVDCVCGCGRFLVPENRYRRQKTFAVNAEHRRKYVLQRYERLRNFRKGVSSYGPEWKAIAASIRERDKVCRHCGKTPADNGKPLDVHHIIPYRVCKEHNPDNLIALCMACHLQISRHEKVDLAPIERRQWHRVCPECGANFTSIHWKSKYCGTECRRIVRNRRDVEKYRPNRQRRADLITLRLEGVE